MYVSVCVCVLAFVFERGLTRCSEHGEQRYVTTRNNFLDRLRAIELDDAQLSVIV